MQQYSLFRYFFRDSCNNKYWGKILLKGKACTEATEALENCFDMGCLFYPQFLNIPLLHYQCYPEGLDMLEGWVAHEFARLEIAELQDIQGLPVWGSIDEFILLARKTVTTGSSRYDP